jgi:hypothetical protein
MALKISPSNHNNHPSRGIHPKNNVIRARMNPAVAMPLDLCSVMFPAVREGMFVQRKRIIDN